MIYLWQITRILTLLDKTKSMGWFWQIISPRPGGANNAWDPSGKFHTCWPDEIRKYSIENVWQIVPADLVKQQIFHGIHLLTWWNKVFHGISLTHRTPSDLVKRKIIHRVCMINHTPTDLVKQYILHEIHLKNHTPTNLVKQQISHGIYLISIHQLVPREDHAENTLWPLHTHFYRWKAHMQPVLPITSILWAAAMVNSRPHQQTCRQSNSTEKSKIMTNS